VHFTPFSALLHRYQATPGRNSIALLIKTALRKIVQRASRGEKEPSGGVGSPAGANPPKKLNTIVEATDARPEDNGSPQIVCNDPHQRTRGFDAGNETGASWRVSLR